MVSRTMMSPPLPLPLPCLFSIVEPNSLVCGESDIESSLDGEEVPVDCDQETQSAEQSLEIWMWTVDQTEEGTELVLSSSVFSDERKGEGGVSLHCNVLLLLTVDIAHRVLLHRAALSCCRTTFISYRNMNYSTFYSFVNHIFLVNKF